MGRFSKNGRKRRGLTRKYKGGYSDAASFMTELVGSTVDQQYNNVFSGNPNTNTGNIIRPLSGGKRRRGGNIGAVLYQAIPSAVLLGTQNRYKKGKSFPSKKKYSFTKRSGTRRNRRR